MVSPLRTELTAHRGQPKIMHTRSFSVKRVTSVSDSTTVMTMNQGSNLRPGLQQVINKLSRLTCAIPVKLDLTSLRRNCKSRREVTLLVHNQRDC